MLKRAVLFIYVHVCVCVCVRTCVFFVYELIYLTYLYWMRNENMHKCNFNINVTIILCQLVFILFQITKSFFYGFSVS